MNNIGMTDAQRQVQDFFQTTRDLLNGGSKPAAGGNSKIEQILRGYNKASEIRATIRGGQVLIVDVDSNIEKILGYTPKELRGQYVSMFLKLDLGANHIDEVRAEIALNNMCIRIDECIKKDGSSVTVLVCIFQIGENDYREFVMPLKEIVGYGDR